MQKIFEPPVADRVRASPNCRRDLRRTLCAFALWLALEPLLRAVTPTPPEGMVFVPGGEFIMGADEGNFDERPAHRVRLSPFYIDRGEVTVAAFAEFVRATAGFDAIEGSWFRFSAAGCVDLLAHYEQRYGVTRVAFEAARTAAGEDVLVRERDALRWQAGVAAFRALLRESAPLADRPAAEIAAVPMVQTLIREQAGMPVRCVTWRDAARFAQWAGKRLPTEAEWEKAARGTDGRIYPWGNEWDPHASRAGEPEDAGPVPVGSFPAGASPYGCLDLAGNVWEWCADWYGEETYLGRDGVLDPQGQPGLADGELPRPNPHVPLFQKNKQGRETDTRKVLRGGCWARGTIGQTEFNTRGARRLWANPNYWQPDTGFRCVKDLP